MNASTANPDPPRAELKPVAGNDVPTLVLGGSWSMRADPPESLASLPERLKAGGGAGRVAFVAENLGGWDSSLPAFLLQCDAAVRAGGREPDVSRLPEGLRRIHALATAVDRDEPPAETTDRPGLVDQAGHFAVDQWTRVVDVVSFIGESMLAFVKLLRRKARFPSADLWLFIQQAGVEALGIVVLISFLVGLILAFVGSVQLEQFGASIYVANLVGLAMVREMGALMAAIIMCGRTGAAYAAQLGTMKVNQEIDAFRTFGFSPVEFLVLPRMLALFLMLPLLTAFANLAGIFGGFLIGVVLMGLTPLEYFNQTVEALSLQHCFVGFGKSFVFGLIVAITGCYNGMRCANNAAGVGEAATTAVVAGITALVVADAVFAVVFNLLGI